MFFPFFLLQGSEMRSCNIGILKLFLRLHSSCTLAHQFNQCFIACSKLWNSSRWSFQTCTVASTIPSNNQSPELLLHAACQLTWWSWWPQSHRHGPCHCRSEKLKRYISPSAVIAKTSSPLIAPKLHSTDLCYKSGTTTCIDVMLWWLYSALHLQGWENAFLQKKQMKSSIGLPYSIISICGFLPRQPSKAKQYVKCQTTRFNCNSGNGHSPCMMEAVHYSEEPLKLWKLSSLPKQWFFNDVC